MPRPSTLPRSGFVGTPQPYGHVSNDCQQPDDEEDAQCAFDAGGPGRWVTSVARIDGSDARDFDEPDDDKGGDDPDA